MLTHARADISYQIAKEAVLSCNLFSHYTLPSGHEISKLVDWNDGENDLIGVIWVTNPDGSTEDHQAASSQGVDLDEMIKTVVKGLVK